MNSFLSILNKEIDLVLIELHATKPMLFHDLPSVHHISKKILFCNQNGNKNEIISL